MIGACAVYGCAGVQRICFLLCSCVCARVFVLVLVFADVRAGAWRGYLSAWPAWPSRRGSRVGCGKARDVTRLFGPAAVTDSVFGAIQLICWHICRFTLPLQGVVACADAACSRRELHNG